MSVIVAIALACSLARSLSLHGKQINYKNASSPLFTVFIFFLRVGFSKACYRIRLRIVWANSAHIRRHTHTYKFWFNSKMCYSNDRTLILWCCIQFLFIFSVPLPLVLLCLWGPFYGCLFDLLFFLTAEKNKFQRKLHILELDKLFLDFFSNLPYYSTEERNKESTQSLAWLWIFK